MIPRTRIRQQIWWELSPGGAGEASQISLCGGERGCNLASPLWSHCLSRALLSSDIGRKRLLCLSGINARSTLGRRFVRREETIDILVGQRVEIHLVGLGRRCSFHSCWFRSRRGGASHVP